MISSFFIKIMVINKVLEATANLNGGYDLEDKDIIGITESVVARSMGNYVSVDEVATETERLFEKTGGEQLQ